MENQTETPKTVNPWKQRLAWFFGGVVAGITGVVIYDKATSDTPMKK